MKWHLRVLHAAAFTVAPAIAADAGEAPFGLAWGPLSEVPRPLKVDREANLTALYYPRGWRPATGAGTAEVILVICRTEGLQQVVWVGVPLSGDDLARARRAIHDEGVRRYGEPEPGPTADAELWRDGQALLASRETADGRRELVMTTFGPDYPACSRTHRVEAGHPAGAHVAELIGTNLP
ncbi:threonyl-trna synthetase [Methylorubrum thiocyanatum]|uniref:Threonyl-trna synthetase n=1 Tax=Methylorubrum thiocyanatum TaxID=47958 RepID=A0AA40VDH5_9HYPH|nr:threonyl-trna synthetase [Methylorubrum thiocyanatum]MBA8914627.1 hypothetical protein [Methylorubrum thiocyanatum]GJE81960.1 hypothetical protein CJNNKLLH_3317 [Methylorubrum thiocyanatum]